MRLKYRRKKIRFLKYAYDRGSGRATPAGGKRTMCVIARGSPVGGKIGAKRRKKPKVS